MLNIRINKRSVYCMALIKCNECQKEISDKATTCPNCGAPVVAPPAPAANPEKQIAAVIVVILFIVLGGWFMCSGSCGGKKDPNAYKTQDNSTMAASMSHQYAKDLLKAPDSAKFENVFDAKAANRIRKLEDNKYLVRTYVDSQNGFGAMLRNYYTCTVQQTGEDNWKLIIINFDK